MRTLARRVSDQLITIANGLRDGAPSADQADEWSPRLGELPNFAEQTRRRLEHASETLRFNPRRLFMRASASFTGYRYTIDALALVVDQLPPDHPITDLRPDEDTDNHQQQFLQAYADVLDAVAGATRQLGELHSL